MDARERFVAKALDNRVNFAALCREYGISRKTGYKWVERYEERGWPGLEELTRRPNNSPLKCSGDVVATVVRIRNAHPTWGARKIADILAVDHKDLDTPTVRTVHRILVRSGFLQPVRRRKRPKKTSGKKSGPPKVVVGKPNDLWTVDFKGWWLAMDMLMKDLFPDFAAALEQELRDQGCDALADQCSGLHIVDRCRCDLEDCAMFYTAPKPAGAYGKSHYSVAFFKWPGLMALDIVNEQIVAVEVLDREDMASALRAVVP